MDAKIKIEILKEIHYIEGNKYHAFMYQGEEPHRRTFVLAINVDPIGFFDLTKKLTGVQTALEKLGLTVELSFQTVPDPNFDTAEDAAEYLENH